MMHRPVDKLQNFIINSNPRRAKILFPLQFVMLYIAKSGDCFNSGEKHSRLGWSCNEPYDIDLAMEISQGRRETPIPDKPEDYINLYTGNTLVFWTNSKFL